MRFSFVLLILSVWCGTLSAQLFPSAIYTEVIGNQVTIHQTDAERNCCFFPDLENLVLSGNTLSWYQTDTMGVYCGCECFFDYSVTIDSLNPGNYSAMVYSVYMSDTIFEGSVDFTISSQIECDQSILLSSIASICHEPISTEDISKEDFVVQVSPGYITISSTPEERILKITLYSISGQVVNCKMAGSNTEAIVHVGSLPEGVYIMSLLTINGQYIRKIPVFR
jgi:hypothetical protein